MVLHLIQPFGLNVEITVVVVEISKNFNSQGTHFLCTEIRPENSHKKVVATQKALLLNFAIVIISYAYYSNIGNLKLPTKTANSNGRIPMGTFRKSTKFRRHSENKTLNKYSSPRLNKFTFRCWFNKKIDLLQVQYYILFESHFGIELNEPYPHWEFHSWHFFLYSNKLYFKKYIYFVYNLFR